MKELGQALWHSLTVVSATLFWLLSLIYVFVAFTSLGHDIGLSFQLLGLVIALHVARAFLTPRLVPVKVGYVIGAAVLFGLMLFSQG
ncbi:MAG: hypothetical protein B7Z26_04445 [Asticcacaulis sp. 32-58-5]|nr:MAG: hypothetical protein B7Z26_04445 [Asticcacaulis sp. 32-58-5]